MKRAWLPLILIVWLAGCQLLPQVKPPARLQENREATPTPFLPQPNPANPEFTLGETKAGLIWFDPHLPPALLEAARLPAGWQITDQPQIAQVQVEVGGNGLQAGRWVYAVVARFATVEDEINSLTLRRAWYGLDTTLPPFIVEADTLAMFTGWWGAPGEGAVQVVPTGKMSEILWQQPEARGIIPFERLEPRLKVLAVDGTSPLARGLDESAYPLALTYALSGERAAELAGILPRSNRDESKMTVVAVTGVTALVRATALYLRLRGVEHALGEVTDWLREADITHINNEVAFRQSCSPRQEGLNEAGVIIFPCSDLRWIELLEAVGTDVVEMTGDHFIDASPENVLFTLDEYHQHGWQTYGGGATLEQGWQPALFEHNGNRIAFLGCNAKGPAYAKASADSPGAVLCDFERLTEDIRRLRSAGYLPIVTFSHLEYETFAARPQAVQDFERAAQAGAVIVSGSQGHLPQAMQFYEDSFLHYGLGNLFFDQYSLGEPFERAFIDRHIFYDGDYLGVELLTLRFEDFLRSRPMTTEERRQLLQVIFEASGW